MHMRKRREKTQLVDELKGSVYRIPHAALLQSALQAQSNRKTDHDELLQTLSLLSLDYPYGQLVQCDTLIHSLSDDGGSNDDTDVTDIGKIRKQTGFGVGKCWRETGEGLDSGHKHAGGNGLGPGDNGTETKSGVDQGIVGLSNGV
jgi:hypothetical protein